MVYDQTSPPGDVESEPPFYAEIRDISFPVVVRGYDRRAVDAYVEHVNNVIAELEVSRSPQAAVRRALERVGEQTSGILQRARETAEEIIASARTEAEEFTGRAKAEAAELVVNTSADADRMKAEAEKFLTTSKAEARPIEPEEEELLEHEEGAEAAPTAIATADEPTAAERATGGDR